VKPARRRRWTRTGKYWFDAAAAAAAIRFVETFLHFTEGEWAGRPFVMTRWERRIVRKIFGWKRPDGTRRYRRLWLELPRKNGKTEFAAVLALLLLVADGEHGAQIYSLASEEGQARIVFEKATRMVAMAERLRNGTVETFKTSLYCSSLMSSFKPLSAAPSSKHGFNPSGFIGDEVHTWSSGELAEVVHEGEGARSQPLDVLITTAGELETYAHEQHEYALAVLRGDLQDDELLAVIFAANDDDDWTQESTWRKANPSYGVSIKPEFLAAECRRARQLPRLENRFRRYYLNQWVEQATRWIPMEYWDCCTSSPEARAASLFLSDAERDPSLRARVEGSLAPDPELWRVLPARLAGRVCAGGLDLATTRDLAALCFWFPALRPGERETAIWKFYLPRDTLKTLKKADADRYDSWARTGALTLTPGNVADYGFIKGDLLNWSRAYRLSVLGIDRWNATQLATELLNTEGLPVELFGQGFASMSGPSKEFERLVMGLELEHGNHPVVRWMAKNVAVDQDAADNIKPTKERSSGKIDGIVAAIMAKGVLMAKPSEQSGYNAEAEGRMHAPGSGYNAEAA
jgi:phage terminase large subunit-like protein